MKKLYELHGEGLSIRGIARELGVARNTVRKYLRSPEVPKPKARPKRESRLAPFHDYVQQRLADGVENCVVLLRELKERGYTGSYTILKEYVKPFRRQRQPDVTVRFETRPGEQAQVDFGRFRMQLLDGSTRLVWAFVMVLSWSRAIYVEFVQRADVTTFIRCHLNAFHWFGGIPQRCLYDNTKVVVLDRDEERRPIWNPTFLDFARRLGFDPRLCHRYRPQTKGRVESGIKYVKGNFWPGARFTDMADLNRQVQVWCRSVADARIHGTTHERPADRLVRERTHLASLPAMDRLAPFLREERKVGRDGFVQWQRASYGVPWAWAGKTVQVQAGPDRVEIWAGNERIAVHPRAIRPGQRFTVPGQWAGLPPRDGQAPRKQPMAVQVPAVEVQQRPLSVYESLLGMVVVR